MFNNFIEQYMGHELHMNGSPLRRICTLPKQTYLQIQRKATHQWVLIPSDKLTYLPVIWSDCLNIHLIFNGTRKDWDFPLTYVSLWGPTKENGGDLSAGITAEVPIMASGDGVGGWFWGLDIFAWSFFFFFFRVSWVMIGWFYMFFWLTSKHMHIIYIFYICIYLHIQTWYIWWLSWSMSTCIKSWDAKDCSNECKNRRKVTNKNLGYSGYIIIVEWII